MKTLTIICKLTKQLLFPVLIAAAFTFYDAYAEKAEFSTNQIIKVFFPTLFFIMYFYGQYKRVEKNSDDREAFNTIKSEFKTLKILVGNLGKDTTSQPLQIAEILQRIEKFPNIHAGKNPPENPKEGDLWLDTN